MYILNSEKKDIVSFPSVVQKYLISKAKLPIYSKKDRVSYFKKTKRLKKELDQAPLWVRILIRGINYE